MGERVRLAAGISNRDLDAVEASLEQWLEDEAAGATVQLSVNLTAGRGKGQWLPRGIATIAQHGPMLVLRLVAALRRERLRRAEGCPVDEPTAPPLLSGGSPSPTSLDT